MDDISAKIDWPTTCENVSRTSRRRWEHAVQSASVVCESLGPFIDYARFARQAELRSDLLRSSPDAAVCIVGDEVVVDGLEGKAFPKLCRALDGVTVDGVRSVSRVPCTDCDTIAGNVRAADRDHRQDTAAQHRALLAHWRAR